MDQSRRSFLKGTAWMGLAAAACGCKFAPKGLETSATMATYADKPFGKLRVGVVGLGRGWCGLDNFSTIPGCQVTAVCDITPGKTDAAVKHLAAKKAPAPAVYGQGGADDWKKLCERDDVDLVYNATPWELHVPIALYAMKCGKHVVTEVPSAFTVDECWELVETSEKTRRHCMQLENCCYGESEMLTMNLLRTGLLGEIIHGEGAYIHDLRHMNYSEQGKGGYWNYWRLRHNAVHAGNAYPTHGLGPIALEMDINRGDRFDWLVSVNSNGVSFPLYAKNRFGADHKLAKLKVDMANMNTSIIKTALGRTIMVQHDVSSPRPYSRINTLSCTKGIVMDYPLRIALEEKTGEGAHSFDDKKTEEIRQAHMHPLWKAAGELAKKNGGHGGMDFLMCLRLAWCLQNGLPLDMNVYDLASWCSLCELTERSARNRGAMQEIPDFTRGAWRTTKPMGIVEVDLAKMKMV